MHYILFIVLIVVAVVVFLHNDHDRSYDKKERRMTVAPEQPKPRPKVEAKAEAKVKPEPQAKPKAEPKVEPEAGPRRTLSWTYLGGLEYDESLPEMSMETEVTGMRYYCSLADVGPVNGIIRPEPDNPHDARAQVVIRADGKKLGYLPRYALDEYENFNGDHLVCPFAGTVNVDNKGYMLAFILVTLPVSPTFVQQELTSYVGEQ